MKKLLLGAAAAVAAITALSSSAHAQFELKWTVDGMYRARGVVVTNMAPEPRYEVSHPAFGVPVVMPEIRRTSYMTHKLRLTPRLEYGSIAKLYVQIDALDDILWGDNNGLSSAPVFATDGSDQHFLGGNLSNEEQASVEVKRAWVEFMVPVGLMRVGRQPSHWGLGLLANGGGTFNLDPTSPPGEPPRKNPDYFLDDDFGDNHFGSTADRVLFATRPITIMKTIQKAPSTDSNLIVAYAYDKLSEAPHYFAETDRRVRPFGQQGFISRGEKRDDANEHVFVLAYADSDWDQVRFTDELKLGTYWVIRNQSQGFTEPGRGAPHTPDECPTLPNPDECVTKDEGTFIWIADFWYRVLYGPWYSEAEFYHIGGESTGGVPFPSANRRKKANINALVWRGGVMEEMYDAILEVGWSSGDDNVGDLTFKQRAIHPDYNVGLILFEEVIRERGARVFGPPFFSAANPHGATGLMPNGGVINAKYIMPKARWRPAFGGFEIVGQVLVAWLDQWSEPPNLFVCPPADLRADGSCGASKFLGTEFDLAVKSRFAGEHIDFSLETGYLIFGDALKTRSDGSGREIENAPSGAFSLQARVAYVF